MANTIIPLTELRQDVVLPVAIYDGQNSNQMLLNRGMALTQENLEALRRRGIKHVAIDSRFVKSVWAAPKQGLTGIKLQQHFLAEQRRKSQQQVRALTERLVKPAQPQYQPKLAEDFSERNQEHEKSLHEFWDSLSSSKRIRGDVVQNVALQSIEHLLQDVDLFVKMTLEPCEQHDLLHQHCLRTAKLAMSIATITGCKEDEVRQLGIGCLLSRVGMDEAIKSLTNNSRELTALEVLELRKHPGRTWAALEQVADLPVGARQVAWQINERWNGTGYPRGRSEKQIHPLARIAAVADVYIALTSPRPHRQAYSPHEAIRIMLGDTQKGLYEPEAIRGLLRTISLFPLGSCVELSNRTLAITIRNAATQYDRPTVKVVCDLQGMPLPEQYINLSESPQLHIVQSHDQDYLTQLQQRWQSTQQSTNDFFADADSFLSIEK